MNKGQFTLLWFIVLARVAGLLQVTRSSMYWSLEINNGVSLCWLVK